MRPPTTMASRSSKSLRRGSHPSCRSGGPQVSDNASPKPPGLVYTFYSYKGGVGRSMALANVGVLMAAEGYRVLLIDWGLEAPGLEIYFERTGRLTGDPASTPGVVDIVEACAGGTPLDWRNCRLTAEVFGHPVDIISAGRRGE